MVPVLFLSSLAVLSLLIWQKDVSLALVWTTFFVLGVLVQGPNMVMYAHIKELVPSSMIGSAMTAINIFTMGGAAFMTQLVGFLLAGDPSSITAPSGFAPAWWFFGGCLALAFAAYIITPDSKVLRTAVARGKEEPHV